MPNLKLTERAIRALKAPDPSGKQTFYWDTSQTGFGVLVSGKNDVKSFVAKGQLNGKGVLKVLGKVGVLEMTKARQKALELFRDLGAASEEEDRLRHTRNDLERLSGRARPRAPY